MNYNVTYYDPVEERFNVLSHGFGALLSFFFLPFLLYKAYFSESLLVFVSYLIYGLSMIVLYTASTLYHSAQNQKYRYYLNIFDHSAIYVLIAGTYAPVSLVVLQGVEGWIVFILSWLFAMVGIYFKVNFIGRYQLLSTLLYVLMGWAILFYFKTLMVGFLSGGFFWFLTGGVLYSLGAVFYALQKVPYNHAVFHVFVLGGSMAHFITLYFYVI